MRCMSCNSEVEVGEINCKNCGASMILQEMNSTTEGVNVLSTEEVRAFSDRDLADVYIGNGVERFKASGFSLWFLLFGSFYAVYRKMWGVAFIWIIIASLLAFTPIFKIGVLIVQIIMSLKFNDWYLNHVDSKVFEIKIKNGGKSLEELMDICKKKGGTSLFNIVLLILMPTLIAFIVNFLQIPLIILSFML